MSHAFDRLVLQTTRLLRWTVYTGVLVVLLGVALAAFFRYSWAVHSAYSGRTSLVVLLLLFGGFIILSPGVTGLYVAKIFGQVKERPLYVGDEELEPSQFELPSDRFGDGDVRSSLSR